jgi:hypothetical protein
VRLGRKRLSLTWASGETNRQCWFAAFGKIFYNHLWRSGASETRSIAGLDACRSVRAQILNYIKLRAADQLLEKAAHG